MAERSFRVDLKTILTAIAPTDETIAMPVLIVLSGLPGTGKSFLAHKIAERMPVIIIESDFVRKALFPRPTYAGVESVWVHRIAHAAVERLLRSGYNVLYDATNLAEWHREKTYHLAERAKAKIVVVRVVAPEDLVRQRLSRRHELHEPGDYSDATWEIYELLKQELEPVRHPHLVVDTSRDIDRAIRRIIRASRQATPG